jgi:hypothetical protein
LFWFNWSRLLNSVILSWSLHLLLFWLFDLSKSKTLIKKEPAKIALRKWSEWIRVFAWGACSFS